MTAAVCIGFARTWSSGTIAPNAEKGMTFMTRLTRPRGLIFAITAYLTVSQGLPAAWPQIGAKKREVAIDPRVSAALDAASLKYRTDRDGDYILSFELDDDRDHVVFVPSSTEAWGVMEIREVFAFAYRSKTRLSQAKLEKMLKANAAMKSGAWQLVDGDQLSAIFSVKVAADCDGDALKTVVWGVARTADEMEQSLTSGKDAH